MRSREPLRPLFLIADPAAAALAWVLADVVRLRSGLVPILAPDFPPFARCVGQLPLVVVLAVAAFHAVGLYDLTRLRRFREEIAGVLKGVGLLALLVTTITFAMQAEYRPRGVLALFPMLAVALVLGVRRVAWAFLGRLRAGGFNQSHALVIGSGRLARHTARSLQRSPWLGITPVAFADDQKPAHPIELDVLGPLADLPRIVREQHVEHVFIALPMRRYAEVRRVFDLLSRSLVEVRLVADAPQMASLSLTTTTLQGLPVIGLRENDHHGLNVRVKRLMDVVLSAAALVVLSPVFAAIAVLVKAGSRGPVFYRQERCSAGGRPFPMLKFRSMTTDAEKGGPQMTTAGDRRVTPVGRFLRASNLDELPQLWNVLLGDMSLVGPRPERPVFVTKFTKTIPNYHARHAVKCGMTGWAQVNGWRGESSLRRRVQFDLYYIAHWNPLFDLRIMLLTVLTMLFKRQKHAY